MSFSFSFPVSLPACCVAHNLPTEMKMWKTSENHHPKQGVGRACVGVCVESLPIPLFNSLPGYHQSCRGRKCGSSVFRTLARLPLLTTPSPDPVTIFIFRGVVSLAIFIHRVGVCKCPGCPPPVCLRLQPPTK